MKWLKKNRNIFVFLPLLVPTMASGQDSVEKTPTLSLKYFSSDQNIPYILVQSRYKVGRKFEPVKGVTVLFYLDSVAPSTKITDKATTNEFGEAIAALPPALKNTWDASDKHKFIAEAFGNNEFDGLEADIEINKAKLSLDTSSADGVKTVSVTVTQLENGKWEPVKAVELRIGIQRMESILKIGEEDTYTTDSAGKVNTEFKINNLPGDKKGNLVLVASVEDNDQLGNLKVEKTVPWGVAENPVNNFNERSLFATRGKSPAWLLFMAYGIIGIVWGTLIYLIFQIFKIRKLGTETSS
ncbi:MAG: hypothetical protein B6D37_00800 [Sphingobacteriales bacterium UTBCD1]|nr:MAG: hypothetical protein B6D37_00800 [Sphingobacteriales bacterium UTBCD1]